MNTKAIYTVHENGKEHYFFSEHAGGLSRFAQNVTELRAKRN